MSNETLIVIEMSNETLIVKSEYFWILKSIDCFTGPAEQFEEAYPVNHQPPLPPSPLFEVSSIA